MLHSMYWLSFILLHRPFFQRRKRFISGADKDIDHVKLCKRAADNIMDLLHIWDQRHGVRYCPVTLGQAIFSSGPPVFELHRTTLVILISVSP